MFPGKRQSYGTAIHYLRGRPLAFQRYLQEFYPIYDWPVITRFFWENPIQARVILEDFQKNNDAKIETVMRLFHQTAGTLMYIIGAKGSGKTCTAFFFAEQEVINNPYQNVCYIGRKFNQDALPSWCKWFSKLQDVPNGYFGIIDELGIQASARDFAKESNKELSQVLQLARQKKIRLIVLTQDARLGEVNVWRLRDIIIWKKSNSYELQDRDSKASMSNKFWNKVRSMMAPRQVDQCLFEYPSERRFIHFTHEPPECWSDELSNIYQDAQFNNSSVQAKIKKSGIEKIKFDKTKKLILRAG